MAAWDKRLEIAEQTGKLHPVLITCPAYLIDNWRREIKDFIPYATVVSADGPGTELRSEAFQSQADFILTSYNNWGQKDKDGSYRYPILVGRKWSACIFDEGHRLRGRNSNWTKHVFRLRLSKAVNQSTPIWLLTGTPFVRDGGDFWVPFHLYDKKAYPSYWKFVNQRCVVITTPWTTKVGNIRPSYTTEFRKELAAFSLRRTVSEIPQLANLEFQQHDYWVDLPKSVVSMIRKAKKSYVLEHEDLAPAEFLKGAGALYVRQRQIATVPPTKQNPKMDWLLDFLSEKSGKVVVYVWYKASGQSVADALGSKAVYVSGSDTIRRRNSLVEKWKDPSGPQALVATIPALKEGISLTEASDVVFLEQSELPADNEQCIKRLCRRGQEKIVQVHNVRAKASVDQAIALMLEDRTLGFNEALAKWITTEDTDEWFS